MSLLFNKDEVMLVNRQLAALIGLNEAIVLQQLHYWVQRKTGGVEYAGKKWVFNTIEQWRSQFPFWSEPTVKRTLQSLKNSGLVLVEKLSEIGRDRTNFYTIDYAKLASVEADAQRINLIPCSGSDSAIPSDQSDPIHEVKLNQSIGSNRSDANKDKDYTKTTPETSCKRAAEIGLVGVSDDLLDDWNRVRKDKKAGNATATAVKLLQAEARKANLTDSEAITVCCGFGWQGFRAAWYLKDMAASAPRTGQQNTHKHAAAAAAIYEGVWDE